MKKVLSFVFGLALLSRAVLSQNLKPALREVLSIGSADEGYFSLCGSLTQNPSRDVLIMDAEGEIIGSLTLPETSHMIHIDSRDFLYYRSAEGMTVKKAKIEY